MKPQQTTWLGRSMVELERRTKPGEPSAALFSPEPSREMTALSAPTRERRQEVFSRLADRHAPHSRKPFQLRDDLALAVASAVRRGRPRVTDEEMEAVLTGFETISRSASQRASQAREVEASVAPQATLAARLERVDAALLDLAGASQRDRADAVQRLTGLASDLGEVLAPHGLDHTWRADAVSDPASMREVVQRAIRATGVNSGHLAEVRRERDGLEQIRVRGEAATLWSELFEADSMDAPEGFAEFANRAISESAGEAGEG